MCNFLIFKHEINARNQVPEITSGDDGKKENHHRVPPHVQIFVDIFVCSLHNIKSALNIFIIRKFRSLYFIGLTTVQNGLDGLHIFLSVNIPQVHQK